MRILVLLTDAFGGCGGIAKFNRDLLTALCAEQAHHEVVAIPRLMARNTGALPDRLVWMTEASRGKWQYLRAVWRSVSDRRRGPVGRRGFDLILCAHVNLLPIAWLACALARRHAVLGGRNRTPQPLLALIAHGKEAWHPRRLRASRFFLRRIDGIVCVSEFTRKRFAEWSGLEKKPSFVIPNSVELSQFGPGPKDDTLVQRYQVAGRRVLLTLARLHPAEGYKGIELVFEVMPRLNAEIPGLCYLVAGDGADRARLAAKARSLGLVVRDCAEMARSSGEPGTGTEARARVIFCGSIPEAEKAEYYRLADAFVMPGWGEGFGIVYLEALACGIPVVGSKLDASGEVLAGCDMAFLVDPRQPAEVYQGIRRAFEARRGVVPDRVSEFSTENFRRRVHGMIEELGRGGRSGAEKPLNRFNPPRKRSHPVETLVITHNSFDES